MARSGVRVRVGEVEDMEGCFVGGYCEEGIGWGDGEGEDCGGIDAAAEFGDAGAVCS